MQKWIRWGLVLGLVAGQPAMAFAGAMDVLLQKLVEKGVLTDADAKAIRQEVSQEVAKQNPAVAKDSLPESSKNWKWAGDIRLREEYRNRTGSGQDANRQRIRFRYGFEAKVADDLKVGARLATGSTAEPISTNQSFETSFNHKAILLDRAFAEYSPEIPGLREAKLTGGIMHNPFWGVGQLVWDDDLNFDGAAVHLAKTLGPLTLFTNDGVCSLNTNVTEASTLWSVQGGAILKPFASASEEMLKNLKLTGALAYHDYMNVTSKTETASVITTAGGLKGNSADLMDLNLLNPTVELSTEYADVPFGLFGDWVHNTAASSSAEGFQLGVKVGKSRKPLDLLKGWEGGYYYERLEPNATFGAFTDSDFGNGGTNHAGHVYWVKFATLNNSMLQLKYFNTIELKGTKNHADTFQADWVTQF